MMRHPFVLKRALALWCLVGTSAVACGQVQPEVQVFGALKNMMMHGDISAQTSLRDHTSSGIYGLGAVAGLKGEILVWDGTPWVSQMDQDGTLDLTNVEVRTDGDVDATLFVAAKVNAWQEVKVPARVQSQADLEAHLLKAARRSGLDPESPFPFLLEGSFSRVQCHVVQWQDGDMEHTCEKHKSTGPHGELTRVEGRILGFHSLHHHRVFTHHSTNVHMHVQTTQPPLVAHVDGLTLGEGCRLLLPASVGEE